MQDTPAVAVKGLSEGERLVNTFVAPSKTFTDILTNARWWGPVVLMLVVGLFFSYAVDKKVGFDAVGRQQLAKMSSVTERLDSLPPDQRAAQYAAVATRTKYQTYGFIVIALPLAAIVSLLWWMSLNFILGANTKYSRVFAVFMYAGLPKLLIYVLAAILLYASVGTENFDIQNPVGTNLGYYLPDSMPALKAAGSFFDIFGLWALALAVMGTAIISGKKMSQTALVVVGWWLFGMVLLVGIAAAFA